MSKKKKHNKNNNNRPKPQNQNLNEEAINENLEELDDSNLNEEELETSQSENTEGDSLNEDEQVLEETNDATFEEVKEESVEEETNEEPESVLPVEENEEINEESASVLPVEEETSTLDKPQEVEESQEETSVEESQQVDEKTTEETEESDEKTVLPPIVSQEKENEVLDEINNLDKITTKYKIVSYVKSGYPFFPYDLIDVLRSDIEGCGIDDLSEIYDFVLNSGLIRFPEVIGMFIYFSRTGEYLLKEDKIKESLPDINYDACYYYAALNAIKYKNRDLFNSFYSELQSSENKTCLLTELNYHKKYRAYSFFDIDKGVKPFKKVRSFFEKKAKKLTTDEINILLKDISDMFGLSYLKQYNDGLKFYTKYSDSMDPIMKEYLLLKIGHNHLIHFEFKKAARIFESILTFTTDKYNAYKELMLAKQEVRIYGELTSSKKMYYNTNEFIILKNTCIEYNNPAYTDRFLKLVNDIKSQVRYELEFNMSQIRRIVTGFSFVFMVIILILGIFIKMKSLKITEGLLFLIIAGIQFLTTRLKKNLIQIIVISSIAFVLFLLSLILI